MFDFIELRSLSWVTPGLLRRSHIIIARLVPTAACHATGGRGVIWLKGNFLKKGAKLVCHFDRQNCTYMP